MRISVIFAVLLLFLSGCATSTPDKGVSEKKQLTDAMKSVRDGYYDNAIQQFKALAENTDDPQQKFDAEVGLAYAYYKNTDFEPAMTTCARLIEQYPTHEKLDYVYYLRGLIKMKQGETHLQRLLAAKVPTTDYPDELREAYNYFSELINFYPQSGYLDQTYQQIDIIRQRLAKYELHLAHNTLAIGNYAEAAHHAEYVNKYYTDNTSRKYALTIMIKSYKALKMPQKVKLAEKQLKELTYQEE
jgi:outer membrane protein assembly factor BamD